jgi:hypothetical protein
VDKIDFSYLQFLEQSTGRVLGRRLQAHNLAVRQMLSDGVDRVNASYSTKDGYYRNAFFRIAVEETSLLIGK